MAKVRGKGTVLQKEIASVFTSIAQVISLSGLDAKPQTYDGTALDSAAAMEKPPTGYVDTADLTGELFFDPANAGHDAMVAAAAAAANDNWKLIFADAGATEWPFTGTVGVGIAVALNDGLKMPFSVTPDGGVTYP